ncbi:MAG: patatin-like phospholipase family protein [Bdellovibrionaceae bacterium]|nr:patatin-like phospholipase family protein [Pseudobdellovibrionaceae bacterium]
MKEEPGRSHTRYGLVLTGGGARAAYQVGALKAIAEITAFDKNPFRIISGYSAGAINGTWLGSRSESFLAATQGMWHEWSKITSKRIFNTKAPNVFIIALRWIRDRVMGGMQGRHAINYLLDTTPLSKFIRTRIDFDSLEEHIKSGQIHAVSVTAANYNTGHSVTFFSSREEIENWETLNRISHRTKISADHVLASSAIPVFFPPVKIEEAHYGDGMVRLNTPLSAAVRLGADKLLVIGIRGPSSTSKPAVANSDVTLGEIAGTVLNGLFFDSLDADIARLERINRAMSSITEEERILQPDHLRFIPLLNLRPTQEVGDMSGDELNRLPMMLRFLLKGIGLKANKGLDLLSYLSFEPKYLNALLELGYKDTMARRTEIRSFFDLE